MTDNSTSPPDDLRVATSSSLASQPSNPLPPITGVDRYGYFPWWPAETDETVHWVHSEDEALARQWIPGPEIWWQEPNDADACPNDYRVHHYGDVRLRLRPTLWRELEHEGFDVGDMIEVLPHGMENDPRVGHIRTMHWIPEKGKIGYQLLTSQGTLLETWFDAQDLKLTHPIRKRAEVSRKAAYEAEAYELDGEPYDDPDTDLDDRSSGTEQ